MFNESHLSASGAGVSPAPLFTPAGCEFKKLVIGWVEPRSYVFVGAHNRQLYRHPTPRPAEFDCYIHESAIGTCCVENCPIMPEDATVASSGCEGIKNES